MKVQTGLLILVLAAGSLGAQTASKTAPAAKPVAKQAVISAKPAAATKSNAAQPQTSAKPAAAAKTTGAKTTAKITTKKTAKKTAKKTEAPAPAANMATNVAPKAKHIGTSKRDPFISPVQARNNGPINCGTGKRCLVLDQTVLQGIVKAPNGMIAVVSNSANKAYFLRENDPVYNGFVMRITPDTVVFREQVTDRLGNKSTREVVKKVNAPVV